MTNQIDETARAGEGIAPRSLRQVLADNWLLFLLRGLAGIGFGVVSLIWPGLSLVMLVILYGAYALVDGVIALVAGIAGRSVAVSRWWLVAVGLFGIAAGVLTFVWPGITALVLLYLIAGWAIAIGVSQIIGAIQLRKEIDNEWLLVLQGALAVVFGLAMFLMPGAGALALIWVVGISAIVYGMLLVLFALKIRKFRS
ncbi:HdeD family acid-resistance protein [Devosia sp.]|uniref:HdeD family acid-resistance protein n=1 Tax=Devosia sp. TaxID=1871048 RepID=UPI002F1764D7